MSTMPSEGSMKKSWFPIVAVVLASVAVVAALTGMQRATAPQEEVGTVKLLVAAKDLPPGTRLDPRSDLKVMEVPDMPEFQMLIRTTVQDSQREMLTGRTLNRLVAMSNPLTLSDLADFKDLELGANMRALSVKVEREQAVSGLVVPGDRVLIYVTRAKQNRLNPADVQKAAANSPVGEANAEAMLMDLITRSAQAGAVEFVSERVFDQPVKVLAVGQFLTAQRMQLATAGVGLPRYDTVTLELTDSQVKELLEKSGAGELTVSLALVPGETRRGSISVGQ